MGWCEAAKAVVVMLGSPSQVHGCRASMALGRRFIEKVSSTADQGIVLGSLRADPLSLSESRPSKRQRLNPDFKHAVIRTAIENRQARNPQALLRALGTADPKSCNKWILNEMAAVMESGKRTVAEHLNGSLVVGMASDGARLGDPPEETIASGLWVAQANAGTVGAPGVVWAIPCN